MVSIPLALQAPSTSFTLRPVRLTDTESLHTNCWSERSYLTVHNVIKRALRYVLEKRGVGVVCVGSDNRVCGYGQMVMWPTCAEISDLIVAEDYRGQGLGTAIIQTLVHEAVRMGAEEVEIGATLNNPRAAALYRRLGFQDSHTVTLNLDHGKENVQFLRLTLSPNSHHSEPDER